MHTDHTLELLDSVTTRMGREFRAFVKKTCSAFETKELKRETAARKRRQMKSSSGTSQGSGGGAALKSFNLRTIKHHSLGDHADTIRELRTNDSFSTEPVSQCYVFCESMLIVYRENSNIVYPRHVILEQATSFSSNSWLIWIAAKLVFAAFESVLPRIKCCSQK